MPIGPVLPFLLASGHAWAASPGGTESASATVLIGVVVLAVVAAIIVAVRNTLDGVLAACGLGAVATVYLTVQHFVALHGGNSICNVSGVINCDKVTTSPWAELGGVAISLYGLGFYAAMGFVAMRQRMGRTDVGAALLLVGSTGAVGYDVFLAFQSYQLGALCIFCAGTWALNVILLVCSTALARRMPLGFGPALAKAASDDALPAVATGLAVFIGGLFLARMQDGEAMGASASTGFAGLYELPRGPIELDGTEPVQGDPSARFQLVEWADFECGHCGQMAPVLKEILAENKDVKLLFKHYPISSECNINVDRPAHLNACAAAAAAECARLQGRFWELEEAMFKNQEYLSPEDVRFMAERQGLDLPSFEQCVGSAAALDAVKQDVAAGATAKIDGTPSIFLQGAFGDQWVKLNVGADDKPRIVALLEAARKGEALPPPPEPPALE